jgi:hypothetical protein
MVVKNPYLVSGIALLSSGCFLDPIYAPATAETITPPQQPTPPLVHVQLPASQTAIAEWSLPTVNPWFPYFKFTLLSALDNKMSTADLPDVQQLASVRRADCAAARIAADGLPPNTLWMVDLRGAASVTFGATLSHRAQVPVAPVLTFNNWPAENEVIPAEETLAALVAMPPRLPGPWEPAVPVFLLDAWRLAYREGEPPDGAVDNRYMLTAADLPDAATLRARGIQQVVYLVEDRSQQRVEEDDLHERFMEYQEAGIVISMIDLVGACEEETVQPSCSQLLLEGRYVIVPRPTIVGSGDFFRRSRGGFGGPVAVPAPIGNRGSWGGGFGG